MLNLHICVVVRAYFWITNFKTTLMSILQDDISSKSEVLYFPLELPNYRNVHRETNKAMEAQVSSEPNKQVHIWIIYNS